MRYSKMVGDDTIVFVYDNANVIEEITAEDINKYYRGVEIIKNDDGLYYIYNGQGDVSILTDNAGNIVANYTFDAYGNQTQENTIYNPFGYRGEYTDKQHGWTLPSNMKEQLENYQAMPSWLPSGAAAWIIRNTMGNFYGYTPADAAQDLKSAEGDVLLKYDGTVKTITNTYYFNNR